jgi:hypothetical protein
VGRPVKRCDWGAYLAQTYQFANTYQNGGVMVPFYRTSFRRYDAQTIPVFDGNQNNWLVLSENKIVCYRKMKFCIDLLFDIHRALFALDSKPLRIGLTPDFPRNVLNIMREATGSKPVDRW